MRIEIEIGISLINAIRYKIAIACYSITCETNDSLLIKIKGKKKFFLITLIGFN